MKVKIWIEAAIIGALVTVGMHYVMMCANIFVCALMEKETIWSFLATWVVPSLLGAWAGLLWTKRS